MLMSRRERKQWMFGGFLFLVVLLNLTGPALLYFQTKARGSIDYDAIQGTILSDKLNSATFSFEAIENRALDVKSEVNRAQKKTREDDPDKRLGARDKKVSPKSAAGKRAGDKSEVKGPPESDRGHNPRIAIEKGHELEVKHKQAAGKGVDVKSFRQKLRVPQVEPIEFDDEALEGLPEDNAPVIVALKKRIEENIPETEADVETDVENEEAEEDKREDVEVYPRNGIHGDDYALSGTFEYDSDWFQADVNLDDDDDNNDVYAFSAHYDASDAVVRVVALTPTFHSVPLFCRFESKGQTLLSIEEGIEVKMKDHHGKSYTAAVILCKVNKGGHPARLAVLQDKIQTPTKYMKVNYPKKEHHAFSVCVTPFSPTYGDAYELVQNTELGIILGAEHFTFYVQSASGPVPTYLDRYQERGLAEVLPWTPPVDDVHGYAQIAAIQDCLFRNKATSDYILFQDINEVFMPLKHKSWKDLIEAKLKNQHKVAAIIFRKSFFPLADAKDLEGLEEYDIPLVKKYKLYVLSNPWRESKVWNVKMRSKFIVIPNRVVSLGIVNNISKFKDGYTSITVDAQEGLLYQYQGQKDESKPLVMDTSARRFSADLIERVAESWNG
ncbi:beta-1,4-galactosyltransferase galt-1-like [Haliotis cracherodii]|uniref:beta-1,4-galactosyltransferase galt-1-like n=1 Tax=Haliotis cracherodii TaxID=6455 RepID=UPI0039ED93ED